MLQLLLGGFAFFGLLRVFGSFVLGGLILGCLGFVRPLLGLVGFRVLGGLPFSLLLAGDDSLHHRARSLVHLDELDAHP